LRQDARKPSLVHGRCSEEVKIIGPRFDAASSAAFNGARQKRKSLEVDYDLEL
jgi:hypothetical protein